VRTTLLIFASPLRAIMMILFATNPGQWREHQSMPDQRRVNGLRLIATDTDSTVGAGDELAGRRIDLLLLLTGRPAALSHLNGDGAERLATTQGDPAPCRAWVRPKTSPMRP
jgi:hypothetical protein